jgi:membrane associated rhomboid family serine protease
MPQPNYRYTRSSGFGYFPPGVKWLIISNCAIFVLWFLGGGALQRFLTFHFALIPEAVVYLFQLWQFVTYMFLHGGLTHLLFNMLTLWFFGVQLEGDWGTRRFLKYYFYCGIAAGVCVVAVNAALGNWTVATLGSSGAIFGVLVAFGVLHPDQTVFVFLFPLKAKYMVMIYAAIELLLTFGPNTGASTVAHLGGMAFGYLYIVRKIPVLRLPDFQYRYKQWRLARSKRKFQVYMRKHNRGGGPWVN